MCRSTKGGVIRHARRSASVQPVHGDRLADLEQTIEIASVADVVEPDGNVDRDGQRGLDCECIA